ncbi:hypothetical protein L6452_11859 [Arctium lappa]|uniref:Uncharacterized protein n=1 Tax=Arctium lappa TaxID=4217 RepID=A0ACB9DPI8_ARCLA|nr:hypothetical protein L6452_11859 [Arctium lappa]
MMSKNPKNIGDLLIPPCLVLILLQSVPYVGAQSSPPPDGYTYANFNPSIVTIIVILIAALFLMGFFSIYIRRRSNEGGGRLRRAFSIRRPTAASRSGLDASVIETFPTFVYSTVKGLKIGKGALECAVCLNEYEDEETLRLIPKCDHVFHPDCIDAWFQNHVTCPVCRANLLPVSGESGVPIPNMLDLGDEHHRTTAEENDDVPVSVSISIGEDPVVNGQDPADELNRNQTVKPNRSVRGIPRLLDKFRSHSTGHSLVQPGENLDRFTLRLPEDVRKQVVNRALLNRTGRMAGEGSEKQGYRTGSGRRKSYKRLESLETVAVRSERWVLSRAPSFLTRAFSVMSPRVVSGNGEASTSSTTPKGSKTDDKIPLNNFGPKSC